MLNLLAAGNCGKHIQVQKLAASTPCVLVSKALALRTAVTAAA